MDILLGNPVSNRVGYWVVYPPDYLEGNGVGYSKDYPEYYPMGYPVNYPVGYEEDYREDYRRGISECYLLIP